MSLIAGISVEKYVDKIWPGALDTILLILLPGEANDGAHGAIDEAKVSITRAPTASNSSLSRPSLSNGADLDPVDSHRTIGAFS